MDMILAYFANYLSTLMEAVFLIRQGQEETPSWKKGTTFFFESRLLMIYEKCLLGWKSQDITKNFPIMPSGLVLDTNVVASKSF